jgi:colanic acid/amylovoran biosynthesis protein
MTPRPIKICILGAAFRTDNMGVSVLAAGAIRCALRRFPLAEIIQLDYSHDGYTFEFIHDGQPIPIRLVNIRFSKKLHLPNNIAVLILVTLLSKLIPIKALRRRFVSSNNWLKELATTDIVLSLAGGDSFSDIYGMRRLAYIALPQILALLAGKRLVLLPQTIGPFRHGLSRMVARYILRNAELVYSRDRVNEKTVRTLLGSKADRLRFCHDLGFEVEPAQPSKLDIAGLPANPGGESVLVGFNVSGLLMIGGYSQNNMFGFKAKYDKLVYRLIEFLVENRSATVLLVPHVWGSSSESDSSACQNVFDNLQERFKGRIGLLRPGLDYREVKYCIGRCDFFVGARMHASIAALSQSVPTVSIAYSDKFIGVMETIDCKDLVADPRQMDEDQIIHFVDTVFAQRAAVRRRLDENIPMVKRAIREAFHELDVPSTGSSSVPAEHEAGNDAGRSRPAVSETRVEF